MADPLYWKEGEGYDIHVLRGLPGKPGPTSKPLDGSLHLDQSTNALPPSFIPHFKGAPNNHGVDVIASTGEVTATGHLGPPQPKFPNFNFLMTARQVVGGVGTYETEIRFHIHDSIEKIWLTPSTLTVHVGSHECRFTVLALFDDGTVGDITDWPQLKYQSAPVTAVRVLNVGDQDEHTDRPVTTGGALVAEAPGGEAVITVNLDLTSPPTDKSATAKVFTKPAWFRVGRDSPVKFVEGPVRPDPTNLNSVKSVVENATNILFVAEGFRQGQEQDFTKAVADTVNRLRRSTKSGLLQPFALLKDSINYWSVFVESREEGISVLGDQEIGPNSPITLAFPVPLPRQPAPSAAEWTVENMIHEGGLPVPLEAPAQNPAAWVASRGKLYDISPNAPLPSDITQAELVRWNDLRSRSLLNERDSAFGLAHYERPRASGQDQSDWRLLLDRRRTNEASLREFIEQLEVGRVGPQSPGFPIGETWVEDASGAEPKDFGLVCLVCRSGTRGGTYRPGRLPHFTASTGRGANAVVKAAANGQDIMPPMGKNVSSPLHASMVARGCGHALGLQDEGGNGEGNVTVPYQVWLGPNILPVDRIVNTTSGIRSIDAKQIKWLWPRINKAALVDVQVDPNGRVTSPEKCDQHGNPNPNGAFLLVRFRKGPRKPFAKGDVVRMREFVERITNSLFWVRPSFDPIAAFPLFVEIPGNDKVVLGHMSPTLPQLGYMNPSGPQLDPTLFKSVNQYSLISPRIVAGNELKLVAEPIREHIDSSDSPLNAPPGSSGATCAPASSAFALVTPTNLPPLSKTPRTPADIIGIYDGGGRFDCGNFRPAGRCKMRNADYVTWMGPGAPRKGRVKSMPFCHVCRYFIVDRVDPTMHGELDDIYELQYPE